MIDLRPIRLRDEQLSYDLGWLIQNEKVSDEELCSFLLGETCAEIERLVSRFMKSPADRIAAVDQIVFTLLLRRGTYRSNISGKALLNQLILEVCMQRYSQSFSNRGNSSQHLLKSIDTRLAEETHFSLFIDSLTDMQRLIVIFYYGQKLSAEEMALLLKLKPEQVRMDLQLSQQKLMEHQRSCQECSTVSSSLASMETALAAALQSNSSLMDTAHENNEDWARSLLVHLRHEKIKQRTHKWALRTAEFILGMVVILFAELGFSHSWPFQPWSAQPTATVPLLGVNIGTSRQPTSVTTTPEPPVPTTDSNALQIDQIIKWSLSSWARWHTLWADVEVKYYNVHYFNDGADTSLTQSLRKQIWLSLPGSSRLVSGNLNGSPDIAYSIFNNKIYGQNFARGEMIDSPTSSLIVDQDLQKLFSPINMFIQGGQFFLMGSETTAGRTAWVMDWSINGRRAFRYWIDQEFGIVLRRIQYGESIFQQVVSDFTVTNISFNPRISPAIFEPDISRVDHFANDFSGIP